MINLRQHPRPTRRIALRWISRTLVAALLLVLSAPSVVSAHQLHRPRDPRKPCCLSRSPARVQYWFSENLEPEFTTITVRDQAGNVIATGGVDAKDLSLLSTRLPPNLPDHGAYIAELRTTFTGR